MGTSRCGRRRWAGGWSTRGTAPEWTVSLGEGAEILADRYGISREAQDEFALRSHHNAATAWKNGLFADEVVAVDGVDLAQDESIRADTSLEALGATEAGVPC